MRPRTLAVAICSMLLTGCVYCRLGVEFDWLGGGSVVQTLKVDRSLVQAGGSELEKLFNGLVRRTRELGGRSERTDDSLQLTIPFKDEADFRRKANLFLGRPLTAPIGPSGAQTQSASARGLVPIPVSAPATPLQLLSRDYWLWTAYRVAADLDLRVPLGPIFRGDFAPGLLQLEFALTTPLPAQSSNSDAQEGRTLTWQIRPGQINRLEADFVVPNLPVLLLFTLVVLLGAALVWNRSRVRALR